MYDYDIPTNNRQGIGMQSPPNLPNQQIRGGQYNTQFAQENLQGMIQAQPKHFMQDAIERKIEKFSSQNVNVQKRVNTSSKFRNNPPHMVVPQISA